MNNIVEYSKSDDFFMGVALREAQIAAEEDEIPIGCVIVYKNQLIGRAHNQVELLKDATAHAEMIAITQAESYREDWRLDGATLFVTKEPCPMCAGAILASRIGKVVFGAPAPRDGAAGTVINILNNDRLDRSVDVIGGIRAEESSQLLRAFFQNLRDKEKL